MSAETGPQGPEPFVLEFDSYEACYTSDPGEVVTGLPDSVRTLLGDVTDLAASDVRYRLDHLVGEFSDDEADAINEALEGLGGHDGYCSCAQDQWSSDEEYFDELLEALPETTWAVARSGRGGEVLDDLESPFTVSDLYARVSTRNGWDTVRIEWDGKQLTACFSSCGSGSSELVLRPLAEGHLEMLERWNGSLSYWDTDVAARILDTPWELLLFAEEVLDTLDDNGLDKEMSAVVDALVALPWTGPFTSEQSEVALGLLDDWEGELVELFRTAQAVVPAAAAV